jgi:hypothetical protein
VLLQGAVTLQMQHVIRTQRAEEHAIGDVSRLVHNSAVQPPVRRCYRAAGGTVLAVSAEPRIGVFQLPAWNQALM